MAEKISFQKVTAEYYDVLKELGNIGAGNATTALAQMLQCKVDMQVPQVRLLNFSEVGEVMGGEEQIVVGIYLAVEGDITGSIMFILEQNAGKALVSKLMGMPASEGEFNEMEISAMKEIGNIITGAYLNSLSQLTNLKMLPSVPDLNIDMLNAILSVPAIEFGIMGDQILLIQTRFTDDVDLNGYFILLPDLESYTKILSALGLSI
ncbi:MAG: chemotaxis protein CheC [Lachnospiraceae bacterium]|nr:chemotaxis protein CheC [Lachnospiraceae bacterium]MDY3797025.1 chemotaxis protein CheC [Agathobacter sp.]